MSPHYITTDRLVETLITLNISFKLEILSESRNILVHMFNVLGVVN